MAPEPDPTGFRAWVEWAVKGSRPAGALVLIAIIAAVLGVIWWFTKADAKGMVAFAAAIGGLSTVTVGLLLARDASDLLHDREQNTLSQTVTNLKAAAPDTPSAEVANLTEAQAKLLSLSAIDLNTLLPKLITTAARMAIAVLLLGMLMLLGAAAAAPEASASPSASASGEVSPTPSAETESPSSS